MIDLSEIEGQDTTRNDTHK